MSDKNRPCVILGSGGHARSLLSLLAALEWPIAGCISPKAPSNNWPKDCPWLGDDAILNVLDPDAVVLANGLGSVGPPTQRTNVYTAGQARGFSFPTLIHPTAIHTNLNFNEGIQIMAGVIIQAGVKVGENALLNTGVIVDHDCWIGAHSHLAPGVTLSGGVCVGSGAHIGTGAVIIQEISIGKGVVVGAGSVVIGNIEPGMTVVGNPARTLKNELLKDDK